jgi:hypothetical protein
MTSAWMPEACTLPTVEQPLRVAEFDQLFATSVRTGERISPTKLQLVLDPDAEASARELCARESECCSFFTFAFAADERGLVLDIEVPATQVSVLDAISARSRLDP